MPRGQRCWIAKFQYPGKQSCWLGTVVLDEQDGIEDAYKALIKLWHTIFPFDPPKQSFEVHKGMYIAIHKED